MTKLFEPLKIGAMSLKHRVVMAPLTRFRADDDHFQLSMAIEYYCQRASVPGTLLITESSLISPAHGGFPNAPGMWNDAQVDAWKKIVDAVHARGSMDATSSANCLPQAALQMLRHCKGKAATRYYHRAQSH